MSTNSDQPNTEQVKKPKSGNSKCTFCRKCYNSGICMMPWPGFPKSGLRGVAYSAATGKKDAKIENNGRR